MKKAVIGALQIGLLWVIYEIGLEAVKILHLPVPGNVFGMAAVDRYGRNMDFKTFILLFYSDFRRADVARFIFPP